jgi:hypothetical protein
MTGIARRIEGRDRDIVTQPDKQRGKVVDHPLGPACPAHRGHQQQDAERVSIAGGAG